MTDMETIEINPLGKTQRKQWENAVRLYVLTIKANIEDAQCERDMDEVITRLDSALLTLGSLESEVIRFMENVFDILEKEE